MTLSDAQVSLQPYLFTSNSDLRKQFPDLYLFRQHFLPWDQFLEAKSVLPLISGLSWARLPGMDPHGMGGSVCQPLVEGLLPQEICQDMGDAEQREGPKLRYLFTQGPNPGLSPRGPLEPDLHLSWAPCALRAGCPGPCTSWGSAKTAVGQR